MRQEEMWNENYRQNKDQVGGVQKKQLLETQLHLPWAPVAQYPTRRNKDAQVSQDFLHLAFRLRWLVMALWSIRRILSGAGEIAQQ